MKHNFPFRFLLILALCLASCAGQQQRLPPITPDQDEPETRVSLNWEILDHKDKGQGNNIPGWAALYLEGDRYGAESLPGFEGSFAFVAANSGTSAKALGQWRDAFSADLDFARLVAARIEKRFLDAAASYPDDEYGGYFEALIRAASDAQWEGAVRTEDFWLYRRFPEADGLITSREQYDFLILVSIDKDALIPQIRALLQNIEVPSPLSRDQRTAIGRVRERFFEGF